jgi:arsenate reductase
MSDTTIFHNPRCGSSRTALAWLEARPEPVEVVEYLKAPLDADGLRALLDELDGPPADLVRKDKRFAELGLDADDYAEVDAVVQVLVEHPELMQRPVVVRDGKAVIARPAESTLEAFLG